MKDGIQIQHTIWNLQINTVIKYQCDMRNDKYYDADNIQSYLIYPN